ncbi:MAG TPA: DUF4349 domain-containing protein [Candidatus Angelobacter sp.]
MSKSNHPIEQEELMAYLDGELATNRAVAAAAHLEHCVECQELAADLRKLSQEMMAWEVETLQASPMPDEIVAELRQRERAPKKRATNRRTWGMLFSPKRLAWAGGAAATILLLSFISVSRLRPTPSLRMAQLTDEHRATLAPPPPPPAKLYAYDSLGRLNTDANLAKTTPGVVGGVEDEKYADHEIDSSERTLDLPTVPMIARVAGVVLVTKEFDKSRAELEEILKRHNGYMGELKVSAPAEAGRSLTATLRIPAQQLDAAMAELKKLGRVEDESQGGEEVTQQYVDLQARLANGIHTEQRLTEILRSRTGKLQDVLKVELEIDRVRGEIEQLQAEKKELSKRVAFATLNTTVKEEYFAKLQSTPPSTGSRFRNAAVDGYNTVVEGLIDVGLFLLSSGPSLLLWAAILFFPVRWAWKKFRSEQKRKDAEEVE